MLLSEICSAPTAQSIHLCPQRLQLLGEDRLTVDAKATLPRTQPQERSAVQEPLVSVPSIL